MEGTKTEKGKLIFEITGDEVEHACGERLQDPCEEAGVPFACTEGICGTCVIEVTEGMENLSEFTEEEMDFLGEQDCERLACQCRLEKPGNVKLSF